jgi:hypothetical protein
MPRATGRRGASEEGPREGTPGDSSACACMLKEPSAVRENFRDEQRRGRSHDPSHERRKHCCCNLTYYHDDPATLWWILFAAAQGGYLASGGRYVRGGSKSLSEALAGVLKSAGDNILLGRTATGITVDREGRASGIIHERPQGGDRVEAKAPIVISNAAPAVVANMLPPSVRNRFWDSYAQCRLSISLFCMTLGLSTRPAEIGLTSYSTLLLPRWMRQLADYRRCAKLMAGMPNDTMPPIAIVDYAAIDSGLGGPPFPVSVVGVDRTANWLSLDGAAYDAKRGRRPDRRDRPRISRLRFQSRCVGIHHRQYYWPLSQCTEGAIYGFAPLPPSGPIWKGPDRSARTPYQGSTWPPHMRVTAGSRALSWLEKPPLNWRSRTNMATALTPTGR